MKRIKIGFVGAGRVTIHHIKLLKKLKGHIKIEAICDLIESKSDEIISKNRSLKIKKFKDYHKMISDCKLDLVAILTEEQFDFWPPLQRQLIRDRLLPRGRLSGETVDVMSLVEEQSYDDERLLLLLPVLIKEFLASQNLIF